MAAVVSAIRNIFREHLALSAKQWAVVFGALFLMVAVTGIVATNYVIDQVREGTIRDSEGSITAVSVNVTSEFREIQRKVDALAGLPWVASALESRNLQEIDQVNEKLAVFNKDMQTDVSYIMTAQGTTLAASNFRQPDSFVGKSYAFRKYFTQAMHGIASSNFSLGVTSRKMGFFSGAPVRDSYGRVIGVAVIKQDLDKMEAFLRQYPYCFFIDRLGVVVLSSKPEYSLKSLWPLDKQVERELIDSKLYWEKPFEPLFGHEVTNGMDVVLNEEHFLATREYIGQDGLSIVFLTRMPRVKAYQMVGYVLTAITLCILALVFYVLVYWKVIPDKLSRGLDRNDLGER
ncbi:MAG TPA: hypothetical protein VMB77_05645 [Syntrophales bacterium]|nr:hypothetical protein [Syntrophales bacterium]